MDKSLAVREQDTPAGKGISIIACEVGDIINVTLNGGAQGVSLASGGTNQLNSFGGFLIG